MGDTTNTSPERPVTPPNKTVIGRALENDPVAGPSNGAQPQPGEDPTTITPRSIRTDGGSEPADKLRQLIAQHMESEFVSVDVDEFHREYFAFVPSSRDIEACCVKLIEKGVMSKHASGEYRFVEFQQKPSKSDGIEEVIFQPLQDIATVVSDYQLKDSQRKRNQFHFVTCPRRRIRCDFPGSNNMIDACMTLRSLLGSKEPLHTSLIPVVAEFKIKDMEDTTIQNHTQCLGAVNQIMNADPRRMFAYGITIESDQVSLWFYSRSHSAKSKRFSFVEEPTRLVSILLTLFYSTSEELGYDPCIMRCGDEVARLWDEAIAPPKATQSEKDTKQKENGDIKGNEKEKGKQKENRVGTANGKEQRDKVKTGSQERKVDQAESGKGKGKQKEPKEGSDSPSQDGEKAKTEESDKTKEIPYYLYELPSTNGSVFYRTHRVISEYRSLCITGRMTRVWEVVEVRSLGDHTEVEGCPRKVLKDVWLDEDARTEKEIQNDIFNDLSTFFSSPVWSKSERLADFNDRALQRLEELSMNDRYQRLFLTIERDWVGRVSNPAAPHSKRIRNLFTARTINPPLTSKPSGTSHRAPGDITKPITRASPDLDTASVRSFVPKKQYRVVFREKCTSLGDLATLGEVIDVLEGVLVALQLLFCAGWVHRDVSSGNILAYKATEDGPWNAKLSDLEYAKRYPSAGSSSDPKTGTPYFMPFEVARQRYMYIAMEKTDVMAEDSQNNLEDSGLDLEQGTLVKEPVVHNFQHDLESLWWIVFWTVTRRVDHKPSLDYASPIFRNTLSPSDARENAINTPVGKPLQAVLMPSARIFALFLERVRSSMRTHYMKRVMEKKLYDMASYSYIHRVFAVYFADLQSHSSASEWRPIRLHVRNPLSKTKTEASPPQQVKRTRKARHDADEDAYEPSTDEQLQDDSEDDIDETDRRKTKRQRSQRSRP